MAQLDSIRSMYSIGSLSDLGGYYDSVRGICCKEWFCAKAVSANVLLSEPIKGLPETIKGLPFKPAFTVFLFVVAFALTWIAWRTIELKIELEPGKPKHLRSRSTFLMYLQYPKLLPTLVIAVWFIALFLLGDQLVQLLWPSPKDVGISDYLALSVAATAVLFPLVILIMDGSKDDRPGVFSTSEVLLRYAYAFPISVMLLSILGLSAFRMNYYWMRVTVVLAVILAAIALLRLLNVIFGPKAWRKTEEKLLKTQARDAIAEIAYQRAGMIGTVRNLKGLEPYITNFFGTFGKEEYLEHKVTAGREGRIRRVDASALSGAIKVLIPEENLAQTQQGDTAPTQEDKPKVNSNFQVVIRANEGEIVEKPDEELALFRYKKGTLDENQISKTLHKISKSFSIDPLAETDLSTEQLDVLLSRIRQLGMDAVDSDNEVLADRISAAYQNLIEAILDAFEGLEIKYSLQDAKQETSFFGKDWKPVTRMFENIGDWTERLLKSDGPSRALKNTIIYTPYRLASTAFFRRDIFTFANSIRIALHQQYFTKDSSIPSAEWLKSLADYHIGHQLEAKATDEAQRKVILDYLRSLFEVILNLTKNTIDSGVEKSFDQAIELLTSEPKLYKYEHFDSEIQIKESYLRYSNENDKASVQEELNDLKMKRDLVDKVEGWREELFIGLAAYCLLQLDNLGNPNKRPPDDFLKSRFQRCLAYLPSSFLEVIRLRIRMNHFEASERWGWSWWEHLEPGEARAMSFRLYVDRVFAFLILRSVPAGCTDVNWTELNLFERDVLDFREDPQSLRGMLPEMNQKAAEFGFTECTAAQIEEMNKCFNQIRTVAKLNSDLRIVLSPVSQKALSNFRESFEDAFAKRNRLRELLTTEIEQMHSQAAALKWGINVLIHREYFIEDPESGIPDFGDHYGGDLGQSEEGWILKALAQNTDTVPAKTASDLIAAALEKGFKLDSMLLLTSRDVYSMKALRSDPAFRYDHQIKQNQFKGKVNGFIETSQGVVPVLSVFFHNEKLGNLPNLLVVDPTQVKIKIRADKTDPGFLSKTGFIFSLVDPLSDSVDSKKLREDLFKRNPDWLKEAPAEHRNEMVGLRLWLRVLEDINVEVQRRPLGFRSVVED